MFLQMAKYCTNNPTVRSHWSLTTNFLEVAQAIRDRPRAILQHQVLLICNCPVRMLFTPLQRTTYGASTTTAAAAAREDGASLLSKS